MSNNAPQAYHSRRHRPSRPMLRTAILWLLACKLTADIFRRVLGLTPPLPRKLVYLHSFARRIPIRDHH